MEATENNMDQTATDGVFKHLRKQDEAIADLRRDLNKRIDDMGDALNGQFTELRNDTGYLVVVSKNLEGFSNFCSKWGSRINRAAKWLTPVVPALILAHEKIWEPFSTWVSAWWKSKFGG